MEINSKRFKHLIVKLFFVMSSIFYFALIISYLILTDHPGQLNANIFWGNKGEKTYENSGIKKEIEIKIWQDTKVKGITASDGIYLDKVLITWDSVSTKVYKAETYSIFRSISSAGPYNEIGKTSQTSYEDRTASPGTIYYYKTKAYNSISGYTKYSAADTGFIGLSAPGLVSPINGSATNSTTPKFIWNSITGAVSYEIEIDGIINNTASPNYISTPLTNGSYAWKVRGIDGVGNPGIWSVSFNITIDTQGPGAPTLVSPVNNKYTTNTTPEFIWNSLADAVSYDLVIDDITNNAGANTNYISTPLTNGSYTWKVRGIDGAGNPGVWSTTWTLPILPKGLILWNKLGSSSEISNSVFGPNGIISSNIEYGSAKFGDGFRPTEVASSGDGRVSFPSSLISSLSAGCIEFWIKTGTNRPCGRNYFLVDAYDEVTLEGFQCPYEYTANVLQLWILSNPPPHSAVIENSPYNWVPGELVHLAFVFKKGGIDGGPDTGRLYVNGSLAGSTNTAITANDIGTIYVGNHRPGRTDMYSTDYIDNIKIWNYAKTDFSDRFVE